jgi:Stress responsive A/B Barrel Domain
MIRHVVTFTWEPTAAEDRVSAALQALRGLRHEVGGMSFLAVAEDAGLSDGNASAVLIADFADAEAFYRYAQDPVHLSVVAEFVRPILQSRAAVQYHV